MKIRVLATLFLLADLSAAKAQTSTPQNCAAVTPATCTIAKSLGRGINMGNMLDAPREGDWGVRLEPAYIEKVAGVFTTVRVPVRWTNHAAPTADATLDEVFAKRVDQVVDAFLAKDMYVILDVHHYSQIFGDGLQPNEFGVDPAVLETRLLNIWRQLADRYRNRSPKLLFELLNEPHGRLNGDPWNALAARTLAVVRTNNPNRTVIIGPSNYNNISDLPKLQLTPDRNLIVAIHNYDPFEFTHQGTSYMPQFPKGPTCCDASQRKRLTDNLNLAATWNQTYGYPLHMGEFGSYVAGDMDSREIYTRFARDEIEKRGIAWTYWEFASSFGVYSPKSAAWIEPIRRALLD